MVAVVGLVAVLAGAAACSSGDASESSSTAATDKAATTVAAPGSASHQDGCGVTLEDVKAHLPDGTGVVQHGTPDPYRCNFTWEDGGSWGIDVARVAGGRSAFETSSSAPSDGGKMGDGSPYEAISGLGDAAYRFRKGTTVNVVVLFGDDVVAVDIVHYGGGDPGDLDAITEDLARVAVV
jgi:hypothetical protein